MIISWKAWLTSLYDFWQFQKSHFVICLLYGGDRLMTKGVEEYPELTAHYILILGNISKRYQFFKFWLHNWFTKFGNETEMTLLLVQNLVKIIGNMLSEKVLKNNILALAKKDSR